MTIHLHPVSDEKACLSYLRNEGNFSAAPRPDLILLVLSMPVMTGREVLPELASDNELNHLPVAVLTTSSDRNDAQTARRLGCSAYVVKPVNINEFQCAASSIIDFWLRNSSQPDRSRSCATFDLTRQLLWIEHTPRPLDDNLTSKSEVDGSLISLATAQ